MEYDQIISAITTVGFPVIMCIGMALYIKYISDKNRDTINQMVTLYQNTVQELNNQHVEESKCMADALNNNTLALQKLTDKLGV